MTDREREGVQLMVFSIAPYAIAAIGGYYGDTTWFGIWMAVATPIFVAGAIRAFTSGDK